MMDLERAEKVVQAKALGQPTVLVSGTEYTVEDAKKVEKFQKWMIYGFLIFVAAATSPLWVPAVLFVLYQILVF